MKKNHLWVHKKEILEQRIENNSCRFEKLQLLTKFNHGYLTAVENVSLFFSNN
jgi:hypothetical protein